MKRTLCVAAALAASALLLTGCSPTAVPVGPTAQPLPPGTTETAAPVRPVPASVHTVTDIPVLAWHQVVGGVAITAAEDQIWNYNKDCAPTSAVCNAPDNPETVSLTQLDQELTWLESQGYSSITAAQYVDWATGVPVALPRKPILLTTDDGTINEVAGVTALLQKHGFNMVLFVVTGFADGATANKEPYAGWNLTWDELAELPHAQWSFAFHAGTQGHDPYDTGIASCTYFYPCQLPGETDLEYANRVSGDIDAGRMQLARMLGDRPDPALLDSDMWAVPWNDLAQPGKPASGTYPAKNLADWAAQDFKVIFLQDPDRNGVDHERYRLEVQGTWSLAVFRSNFLNNVRSGFFNLAG